MHPHIVPLTRVEEVDSVLAQSAETPVLIFKHSYSCGTSAEALDELVAHLEDNGHHVPTMMVTVQTHRDVSNAVASRLGIRHETPQALLIRNGRVVWSASHFRVTAAAVQAAIESQRVPA
jgi:bacillithiol system protein YtxJ